MKSFHRPIHFLPLFCYCQLNSIPLFPRSYPDKLASRSWTRLYIATVNVRTLLYNHFARTIQKTQPSYCWEGAFTAPLHNNGSYSIVACVFVVAVMCLPSRCLAMNVYSDFAIPAFGRHVTIHLWGGWFVFGIDVT
jgi:hypothetical protein